MRDKQGVLRGSCTLCDCRDFEPPSNGPQCEYCTHTAPQHRSLDFYPNNGNYGNNTAGPSNCSSTSNPIGSWVVNLPHASDLQDSASPNVVIEYISQSQGSGESGSSSELLPKEEDIGGEKDSDGSLVAALNAGSVTPQQELQLIRDVSLHLKKKNKDKPKYLRKAARKMHKKWHCIGSKFDANQAGLHYQLRRRMEKLRKFKKSQRNKENAAPEVAFVDDEESLSGMSHDVLCLKLKVLWENESPSKKTTVALMNATRDVRILEVQVKPLQDILMSYPCLREKDYLLSELVAITKVPYELMMLNWDINFPKLVEVLIKENAINIPTVASEDQKEVILINGLHKLFQRQKKPILEIYPENTTVADTQPKGRVVGKRSPPQLIAIGDIFHPPVSFHTFLDGQIIFVTQSLKEALYLLISVYYVFAVKWCPATRPQLLLLTGLFVCVDIVRRELTSNVELKSVMKNMGITL